MGQKALEAGDLDREIGRLLEEAAEERDMSHRQLAAISGVSRARIDRVLAGVRPIYASEIQALADALGLRASTVVAEAEEAVAAADGARASAPMPAAREREGWVDVGAAVAPPDDAWRLAARSARHVS